jgi:hypothetical protein
LILILGMWDPLLGMYSSTWGDLTIRRL